MRRLNHKTIKNFAISAKSCMMLMIVIIVAIITMMVVIMTTLMPDIDADDYDDSGDEEVQNVSWWCYRI